MPLTRRTFPRTPGPALALLLGLLVTGPAVAAAAAAAEPFVLDTEAVRSGGLVSLPAVWRFTPGGGEAPPAEARPSAPADTRRRGTWCCS